jgi:DNA-binding transcriptional LysR family regulator
VRIFAAQRPACMWTSLPFRAKSTLSNECSAWNCSNGNRVLYDRLMAACVAGRLVPRQVHEANNEYVIVNLVAAGVRLAFLDRSFGSVPSLDVILRDVDDLSVPVMLELVWRRDNRLPALARSVETVAGSDQVTRRNREAGAGARYEIPT